MRPRHPLLPVVLLATACTSTPRDQSAAFPTPTGPVVTASRSSSPERTGSPSRTPSASDATPAITASSHVTTGTTPAVTGKDLCSHRYYRCVDLRGAKAWWGRKPMLYDRGDAGTFLLNSLTQGAPDSASPGDQPNVTAAFPSARFAELRRGDTHGAVESRAVLLRVYLGSAEHAPAPGPFYRELTVRGRRAFAFDYDQEGSRRRTVSWSVPAADGAVIVFRVEDSPSHRSEAQLVSFLNGLAEA